MAVRRAGAAHHQVHADDQRVRARVLALHPVDNRVRLCIRNQQRERLRVSVPTGVRVSQYPGSATPSARTLQ